MTSCFASMGWAGSFSPIAGARRRLRARETTEIMENAFSVHVPTPMLSHDAAVPVRRAADGQPCAAFHTTFR